MSQHEPAIGLGSLPIELQQYLVRFLGLPSLARLAATSAHFASIVEEYGFRRCALSSLAYAPSTAEHLGLRDGREWSWSRRTRWSLDVSEKWQRWSASSYQLGETWQRTCMPIVKIWAQPHGPARLVIARGQTLDVWEKSRHWQALADKPRQKWAPVDDITGIAPEEGSSDDLVISYTSGLVVRLRLKPDGTSQEVMRYSSASSRTVTQGIASGGNVLFAISSSRSKLRPSLINHLPDLAKIPKQNHSHTLSVHLLKSPWIAATSVSLPTKPWSVLSSSTSTADWLALGLSGLSPLQIYHFSSSGEICSTPTSLCLQSSLDEHRHKAKSTSIYGLSTPTISSIFPPTSTIVSAAFDSLTRVHDLRTPASLGPAITLADPWNDDPCYSVACGGPIGTQIVVGTARNASIRCFDARMGSTLFSGYSLDEPEEWNNGAVTRLAEAEDRSRYRGLTTFAPGKDRSPVYSIAIEYSKIWGATEKRAFVIDFEGPERKGERMERMPFYEHTKEKGLKLQTN